MTAVKTLRELAALSATGALHLEGAPAVVVYLRDGQVCQIDAGAVPGIGQLLTASGRVSDDVWQSVLTVGAPAGRVGALLVEQGYLSQGELELCANAALFDAAFFALNAEPTSVRFAAGQTSWFGGVLRVDVERLIRETARRRELLAAALPSGVFDQAPVVPVARMPRDQIVLDGLRWELLVHADGHRTPVELAGLLGRSAFATLLEVRRLAAVGLLQPPSEAVRVPTVTPYRPAVSGSRLAGPRLADPGVAARPTTAASSSGLASALGPVASLSPEHEPVPPAAGSPSGVARLASPAPSSGPAAPPPTRDGGGLPPLPRRDASGEQPPLPRWVTGSRVVRPSQGTRADPDEDGGRWSAPSPDGRVELPSLASLTRVRDALQEFS